MHNGLCERLDNSFRPHLVLMFMLVVDNGYERARGQGFWKLQCQLLAALVHNICRDVTICARLWLSLPIDAGGVAGARPTRELCSAVQGRRSCESWIPPTASRSGERHFCWRTVACCFTTSGIQVCPLNPMAGRCATPDRHGKLQTKL